MLEMASYMLGKYAVACWRVQLNLTPELSPFKPIKTNMA
jgi:hypothetical protein